MENIDHSINLLEELDNISKIHILERDDIDGMMIEFAKRIVRTMHIERMSVWLFNQEKNAIISMGKYDSRDKSFKKENILSKQNFPKYFKSLEENKILIAQNIFTNENTTEFSELYSKPNNIISLMDIPLRIAGELVGVMCFEKTGEKEKHFTHNEQTFAFSISLVFASNLEARHRRAAQHKLTNALKEKDLLIKEINHRVKNNFSILISLLRISKEQGLTSDPRTLLEEYEHRIFSMMKIQDLLFETENYSEVKISAYLNELIKEFRSSHPELAKNIKATIEESNYSIESKSALHIGLIVTEIFLNSVKHSTNVQKAYSLELHFKKDEANYYSLSIKDNGEGFDFNEKLNKNTLGLPLIKDLADDLKFISTFPSKSSTKYTFKIPA